MPLLTGWSNQELGPGTGGYTTYASISDLFALFANFNFDVPINNVSNGDGPLQFAYNQVSVLSDITIQGQIITAGTGSNRPGVGFQLRDTLALGSKNVTVYFSPNANGSFTQNRSVANLNNTSAVQVGTLTTAPYMRLAYSAIAGTVTVSISPDGVTWTSSSPITFVPSSDRVYVGIYAQDHATEAHVQNVSVNATIPPAPINYTTGSGFQYSAGHSKALASVETSPGVYQLLVGDSRSSKPVYARDSTYTTFADNSTAYESGAVIGSILLAQPGELAEMGFITADFIKTGSSPALGVMIDEISLGPFSNLSGTVLQDPPLLYGATNAPTSLYANRYYMKQTVGGANPPPAFCRHLQVIVDFGNTDTVQNEALSLTIYGTILVENN